MIRPSIHVEGENVHQALFHFHYYTYVFIWKDLSLIVIFIEIQNMENFYVYRFWHHAILLSWLLKVQYLWSFFKAESLHDVKWSVFLQSLLRCQEWVLTCKCHGDNSLAHIQVLSHLLHIIFAVQMTVQDCTCWRHQMENFPHYWSFVWGSTHKGQWCRALMFSLICPWNKRLSK